MYECKREIRKNFNLKENGRKYRKLQKRKRITKSKS